MRPRLACAALLLSLSTACSSAPSEPDAPVGDGSGLPLIYWKVELARRNAASPLNASDMQFVRLFDDGRVVTYLDPSVGLNKVVLRDAGGLWKEVTPPMSETGSFITWYEDEGNFGGYVYGPTPHGWVVADGNLRTFGGPPGFVRGKLPDGSYLLTANLGGLHSMLKWTPSGNGRDALDIHNGFYQDRAPGRLFGKLAANGTFLMVSADATPSNQAVVVEGRDVPIGPDQFNMGEPVDYTQESLFPCCRIATIDRVRGGILGIKNGKPVIKVGDSHDLVADERAQPYALNGRGDVIYTSSDSRYYQSPRMRFKGTNYQFPLADWSRPTHFLDGANANGIPYIVDMNESGQVLLAVAGQQANEKGYGLYVATPSLTPVPPPVQGRLTFAVKSGPGKAPEEFEVLHPLVDSGTFLPSSLVVTVAMPSSQPKQSRVLGVTITNGTKVPFALDAPISVRTSVLPTGSIIATVTYIDLANSINLVASAGSLRVTRPTPAGGFTVVFEDVEMGDLETVYAVKGEVTVPGAP